MKALTTILALAIIAVSIGIGFGIVARVDEETAALLIGTLIGIITAAPCAAAITYILMRNRSEYSWRGGCIVKRNDEPQRSVTPYNTYREVTTR